jgi:hypothetical protein
MFFAHPRLVAVHLEEVNPSLKVSSNWKNFLSSSFSYFEELINVWMRHKPFRTMVTIIVKPDHLDVVFYDYMEIFTIWELLLLCVVSLHHCVVSFHFLLQGVWICTNPNWKKISSILQEIYFIHSCTNKFDTHIL